MPLTWNDGMLESWNNGQKRVTSVLEPRLLGSSFTVSPVYFFIHGLFIPQTALYFKQMKHDRTQYSIIPLFHHSDCERSEL